MKYNLLMVRTEINLYILKNRVEKHINPPKILEGIIKYNYNGIH